MARIAYAPMATPATAPLLKLVPLLEDDAAIGTSVTSAGFVAIVVVARLEPDCCVLIGTTLLKVVLPLSRLFCGASEAKEGKIVSTAVVVVESNVIALDPILSATSAAVLRPTGTGG